MTSHLTLRETPNFIRKQNGQALMILLILLVTGALTFFIHTSNSNKLRIERDKKTDAALAQAKEALLGYAATYRESHPNQMFGYLPCPDDGSVNPEGSAAASCSSKNVTVIGRLPWKKLGLPPLRDGNGECLWYAVSGNFKNNPNTDLINWDTNGLIEIYASDGTTLLSGNTPPERVVAAIISSGQAIDGQNRASNAATPTPECGGNYTPANYLDTDTASGISNSLANTTAKGISKMIAAAFSFTAGSNTTVNDKLAFITPNEIFANHIEKRTDFPGYLSSSAAPSSLVNQIASCLASKAPSPGLPWAVPLALTDYDKNNFYIGTLSTYAGRVPYNTVQSCGNANEWWDNWKDNLFYVVSKAAKSGNTCSVASDCLIVNGQPYAAVVIFSGKKLSALAQVRNNDSDKGNLANYLEDDNLTTFTNNTGQGNIKLNTTTSTFNDTVICINQSFAVVPNCNIP